MTDSEFLKKFPEINARVESRAIEFRKEFKQLIRKFVPQWPKTYFNIEDDATDVDYENARFLYKLGDLSPFEAYIWMDDEKSS